MVLVYGLVNAATARLGLDARRSSRSSPRPLLLTAFVLIELALGGAARPALDLPRPLAHDGEPRRCSSPSRGCSRCSSSTRCTSSDVLGFEPLKAGVAFLPFTAGIMVSAGLASSLRAAHRRPAGRRRRHGADDPRAAPLRPDAGRRLVRDRRPAGDDPRLARHGRDLHAADARGDDRASRTRTRASRPGSSTRRSRSAARSGSRSSPRSRRATTHGEPVIGRARSCTASTTPSPAPPCFVAVQPRRLRSRSCASGTSRGSRPRSRRSRRRWPPDDRAARRRAAQSRAGARRGGAGLRRRRAPTRASTRSPGWPESATGRSSAASRPRTTSCTPSSSATSRRCGDRARRRSPSDDPGEAFFDFVRRVAELNMRTPGLHRCVVHCGEKPGAAELERLARQARRARPARGRGAARREAGGRPAARALGADVGAAGPVAALPRRRARRPAG